MCSCGVTRQMRAGDDVGASLNAIGQRSEQQVMIDEVALVRIKVGTEPALVAHDACQFTDDPVGKLQPLDDLGLLRIFWAASPSS